jgi:uncharacterized membrane protein YdjX (TVP38/TMEM64 family)
MSVVHAWVVPLPMRAVPYTFSRNHHLGAAYKQIQEPHSENTTSTTTPKAWFALSKPIRSVPDADADHDRQRPRPPPRNGSFRNRGDEKLGNRVEKSPTDDDTDTLHPAVPWAVLAAALVLSAGAVTTAGNSIHLDPLLEPFRMASSEGGAVPTLAATITNVWNHPQEVLSELAEGIRDLGPLGVVYFGILYTVAEILAVPATPLTLSAGYLFGLTQGVAVVLIAATVAASVAFVVGKTVLRSWVEGILEENPRMAKLDAAIGKEGFQLLLLVRLSPIFPFALSNYVYGASSISFGSYFCATLLGFAPGTVAYVYTGMVGQALTVGNGTAQPWYVYGAGFVGLTVVLKLVADVANNVLAALEDDEVDVTRTDEPPTKPQSSFWR